MRVFGLAMGAALAGLAATAHAQGDQQVNVDSYSCQDMMADALAQNTKRIGIAVIIEYVHQHDKMTGGATGYDMDEIVKISEAVGGDCAVGDRTRLLKDVLAAKMTGGK
jgi:hypothetical protein